MPILLLPAATALFRLPARRPLYGESPRMVGETAYTRISMRGPHMCTEPVESFGQSRQSPTSALLQLSPRSPRRDEKV